MEKFGLAYFFPGSNLGIKSFLGKEGRNLAAAENGEVWWLCQGILRTDNLLEDQSWTGSDGTLVPDKSTVSSQGQSAVSY